MSAFTISISAYLILYGISRIRFFTEIGFGATTDCYLFGYFPVAFGVILLLFLAMIISRGLNQFIVITPLNIAYQKGRLNFTENWENLMFAPPKKGFRFTKSAVLGSKDIMVRIDSLFFPKFNTVIEVIRLAKESRKTMLMEALEV
ncbi:MAG: hypothetical protein RDV48_15450 [Candidatus Eremiobacteraeota bacterium]|nr:hypothetical protein [Candidatus Eremiobacteraeota bacterium]